MLQKTIESLKTHLKKKLIINYFLDIVVLSLIYYCSFFYFNLKFSIQNDLLNELIILVSTLTATSFFICSSNKDWRLNDAIKALTLLAVFASVAFLFYQDNIALYSACFTSIIITYFFIAKPTINFFINIKHYIKSIHQNCEIDIILEENFSKIQKDVIDILNQKFRIKNIVNFSDFNVNNYRLKTYKTIEEYENNFQSIKNIVKKNNTRKVIYIAGAPNQERIKQLLKISVKYNFQLLRTNYLENLANITLKENINLIPFSFKDFETQLKLEVENKHFLINFFRNKNIWISYNGEDIIFEFIRQIAKSGVGILNIFVNSEKYASEINLLLKDFHALNFANHFETMCDFLKTKHTDSPDYIFHSTEINDPSCSLDNFFSILNKNFFEVKKLYDVVQKSNISGLFLISDVNNFSCTNWVNVTQRLGEYYLKNLETKDNSYVIRIPKSKISISTLDDFLISEINSKGTIEIPESFKCNYLTSSLFNLFIKALKLSLSNPKNIIHVKPKNESETLLELIDILLNIKGINIFDNITYFDDIKSKKEINEFPPLSEKMVKLEDGIFINENFIPKSISDIKNLEKELILLIENNSIHDVINKCVSIARGSISKK